MKTIALLALGLALAAGPVETVQPSLFPELAGAVQVYGYPCDRVEYAQTYGLDRARHIQICVLCEGGHAYALKSAPTAVSVWPLRDYSGCGRVFE
ncbi:MAG: hypothetical protein KQJ78_23985 [Deltaproteobacteria bacterium]|nr:hypothetical protein [Deltaproteobacteria bacterium]